jgi:hypothetical protein
MCTYRLWTSMTNRQYRPCSVSAVEMDEIGGEHARGLSAQELPLGRAGLPFRRGRNLQGLENPADRGGTGSVAELEQLVLDPLVSPAVILAGELPDQHYDLRLTGGRPVRFG